MKRFANLLLLMLTALAFGGSPAFDSRIETVEARLRTDLSLPTGPATQFVHFYIPGEGYFLVLTTDFQMTGQSRRTPFGSTGSASPSAAIPSRDKVHHALKQALISLQRVELPRPPQAGERMHLILIHRPFFKSPFGTASTPVSFKVWVSLSALMTDADPLAEVRTD